MTQDRSTFLGGTDAAAVLGLSRWKTPLQLWAEKTGNFIPEDRSGDLPVRVGKKLEDLVADLFSEDTGLKVRRVNEPAVHAKYGFLRAQIDRRVVGSDEILEAKTASGWKAREWEGEDMPQEYVLQVYHQLAVLPKVKRAYLACLIGGNQQFVYKTIDRDDGLIDELVKKEVDFWTRFVVPKVMPMVSSQDAEVLYAMFPHGAEGKAIELPGAETIIQTINRLEEKSDKLVEEVERYRNQLRALLQEATIGHAGRFRVTWKPQKSVRLDLDRIKAEAPEIYEKFGKKTETRVLRISEIKTKTA